MGEKASFTRRDGSLDDALRRDNGGDPAELVAVEIERLVDIGDADHCVQIAHGGFLGIVGVARHHRSRSAKGQSSDNSGSAIDFRASRFVFGKRRQTTFQPFRC